MRKRFRFVPALMASLILCFAALAPASSLAAGARVSVAPGIESVPDKMMDDLASAYGPDETVTILSISFAPIMPETSAGEDGAQAASKAETKVYSKACLYTSAAITATQKFVETRDDFILSFAKGETDLFSEDYVNSISCMVSGDIPVKLLGLTESLNVTIEAGTKLSGPPEESINNSREYRVKYYCDKGSYKAERVNVYLPSIHEYIAGNWSSPACGVLYCIDRYIH